MSNTKTFLTSVITGLSNLTRLEVNTMVGNYTFNQDSNGANTTLKSDSTGERMCSQINLITGDISTAMTDKFVVDYKELRDFHQIRETQGHEIVNKNIAVLKEILAALGHFNTELEKEP